MGVTTSRRGIVRVVDGEPGATTDVVAVESPLTIVLDGEALVTTMRTPGHDLELVAGWLVNESGVRRPGDIAGMGAFATQSEDEVDTVRITPRPRSDGAARPSLRHEQRVRRVQRGRPGRLQRA